MRHRSDDADDWYPYNPFLGFGSAHDMAESDPRNPKLAGLKSVSYAACVAMRRPEPPTRTIGFRRPR
jgi:hypothetical protein